MYSIITNTFLIFFAALSPFPALPLIILNYQRNGIIAGIISSIIAGISASIFQFLLSYKSLPWLERKFYKYFSRGKRFKAKIKNLKILELFFLQLSGTISASVISIAAGMSQMHFKKFFIATLFSSIFGQLIFIVASNQTTYFEQYLIDVGFIKSKSFYISFSLGCLLAFTFSIFLKRILTYFSKIYSK